MKNSRIDARLFSMNSKLDISLTAGPRPIKDATLVIQKITEALLEGGREVTFFFKGNDLIVNIGTHQFNISLALQSDPDFEHLTLTTEQLNAYVKFLRGTAKIKPVLRKVGEFPTEAMYTENELEWTGTRNATLHYGEKLAITLYTQQDERRLLFKDANEFLRHCGRVESFKVLSQEDLQSKVKELLLVISVASHGISRLSSPRPTLEIRVSLNKEEMKSEELSSGKIILIPGKTKDIPWHYFYKVPSGVLFEGDITIAQIKELLKKRKIYSEELFEKLLAQINKPGIFTPEELIRSIIEELTKYPENYQMITKRTEEDITGIVEKKGTFYTDRSKAIAEKKLLADRAFHSTAQIDKYSFHNPANIFNIYFEKPGIHTQGKLIAPYARFPEEHEILYVPGTKMRYLAVEREDRPELQRVSEHLAKTLYFTGVPTRSIDEYKVNEYSFAVVISELKRMVQILSEHKANLTSKNPISQFFVDTSTSTNYITTILGMLNAAITNYKQEKTTDLFDISKLNDLKKHINGIIHVLQHYDEKSFSKQNKGTIQILQRQLIQLNNLTLNLLSIAPPHKAEAIRFNELIYPLHYVYEKYLSKPYSAEGLRLYRHDAYLDIRGLKIYRPNHCLGHTARIAFFLPHLIDYYAKYAKDEKFRNFCKFIPCDELLKIQKAQAFDVTGRESDLGFSDNPEAYMKYRQRCGEQFADFARGDGWSEEDIKRFQHLVVFYGDPDFDKKFSNEKNSHYIAHLMTFTHKLDLLRCYDPYQYGVNIFEMHADLTINSEDQAAALHKLILLAQQSLVATGDRLLTNIKDGKLISVWINYNLDLFFEVNTNPKACLDALIAVQHPDIAPVQDYKEEKKASPF